MNWETAARNGEWRERHVQSLETVRDRRRLLSRFSGLNLFFSTFFVPPIRRPLLIVDRQDPECCPVIEKKRTVSRNRRNEMKAFRYLSVDGFF